MNLLHNEGKNKINSHGGKRGPLHLLRQFLRLEAASGVLLFLAAILALIWANSGAAHFYQNLLIFPITVGYGAGAFTKPLLFWVNDGLMAIFFLLVGLELKHEMLAGVLSSLSAVALPGIAAIGGMVVPALIFAAINFHDSNALAGWAVPVATDIAFALGVLNLFGQRVPLGLKMFLMALAIFDDVGAILIIALFHTAALSWWALISGGVIVLLLGLLNRLGVQRLTPYFILGVLLWISVLKSGVHATVAGVILAFMLPRVSIPDLEHRLHPWVAYLIMPLFALTNAGLSLSGMVWTHSVSLLAVGIFCGLLLGKQLGVFCSTWLLVKTGLAKLPAQVTWFQLYGVALLCGIGFTMSLFLGTLAFEDGQAIYMTAMRFGVLVGSLISGIAGALVLRIAFQNKTKRRLRA